MKTLDKSTPKEHTLDFFSNVSKGYIGFLIFLFFAPFIQAQTYPNKPIKMFLPYGAGGIGDLTARVITQKMSENMGQQIIIDNKPSAGGAQAFLAGLQSPADGYTLVMGGNGSAISQSLFKNLPYNILTDFNQVSTMAKFSLVLLVNPDSKYKTVADVIAEGKARPKSLNFGSVSVGSTQFLAAELFKQMAGIEAQTIPYKVSAGLFSAIRSGEIDVGFEFVPPVLTSIKAGTVKALAIAAEKRNLGLPDVPTVDESGLIGYEVTSWNAVSAKTGTPQAIIEKLSPNFEIKRLDVTLSNCFIGIKRVPGIQYYGRVVMVEHLCVIEEGHSNVKWEPKRTMTPREKILE